MFVKDNLRNEWFDLKNYVPIESYTIHECYELYFIAPKPAKPKVEQHQVQSSKHESIQNVIIEMFCNISYRNGQSRSLTAYNRQQNKLFTKFDCLQTKPRTGAITHAIIVAINPNKSKQNTTKPL